MIAEVNGYVIILHDSVTTLLSYSPILKKYRQLGDPCMGSHYCLTSHQTLHTELLTPRRSSITLALTISYTLSRPSAAF